MKFDPEKILAQLSTNKRVAETIKKHKLTKEQQIEAIPILYEIKNELPNAKVKTDLEITSLGGVEKVVIYDDLVFSHFEENILTQEIQKINFEKETDFYKTNERKILVNKLSKYVLTENNKKGLYIFGNMGIGKTFIIKKIVKKMAEKHKKVGMVNLVHLNLTLRNSFNDPERYLQIFNILKNVNYLFLDDIGSETISTWFRDDFLFPILDFRSENNKTTFFTSNYSLNKLEEVERRTQGTKYQDFNKSKRLIERINSLAEPFNLKGLNYRTEKLNQKVK